MVYRSGIREVILTLRTEEDYVTVLVTILGSRQTVSLWGRDATERAARLRHAHLFAAAHGLVEEPRGWCPSLPAARAAFLVSP